MKQVASKPLYCEKSMNGNFKLDFLIFACVSDFCDIVILQLFIAKG